MKINKITTWIVFYLCTVVASSAGAVFNFGQDNEWYTSLIQPELQPPAWIFGPVWTVLYILIATSAYRIMFSMPNTLKPVTMSFWSLQMAINVIWTPVFIGAQNLELAFYYIIGMWTSTLIYIIVSWSVDRWASWLMVPYLLWVSFAGYLNYNYWQLNL
jgi:benzodiazapine receptor